MLKKITRQQERMIIHSYRIGENTSVIAKKNQVSPRIVNYYVKKSHADWGELPHDCPMPVEYDDFIDVSRQESNLRKKQAICPHSALKCSSCGKYQDNLNNALQAEIERLKGIVAVFESSNI